jgi:hypothetical protein
MSQPHNEEVERGQRHAGLISAYQAVFSSPEGRMVLEDLMHQSGFLAAAYSDPAAAMDGAAVALRHSFHQGRRSLFLHILHRRGTPVSEIMRMIEEATRRGPDAGQAVSDAP